MNMGQIHFHIRSFPLLPIPIPKLESYSHSRGIPVEFPFPSSSQIQTLKRSEKQRESSKSDIFPNTRSARRKAGSAVETGRRAADGDAGAVSGHEKQNISTQFQQQIASSRPPHQRQRESVRVVRMQDICPPRTSARRPNPNLDLTIDSHYHLNLIILTLTLYFNPNCRRSPKS